MSNPLPTHRHNLGHYCPYICEISVDCTLVINKKGQFNSGISHQFKSNKVAFNLLIRDLIPFKM